VDRLRKSLPLLTALKHRDMDPRVALTLLHKVHIPRALYLAQVCPPPVVHEALTMFDEFTFSAFREIFGQDIADYWIEHPGGANIPRMTRLAPHIFDRIARTSVPPNEESLEAITARELGPPSCPTETVKLNSAQGFKSRSWLSYRPGVHFPPGKFVEAVRIRCNAPPDQPHLRCECGISLQDHRTHLLSCKYNRDFTATHRHNEILASLANCSRAHGIPTVVEPRCYAADDNRRPDITFCLGSRSVAVDLTIVDPTCKSYANISLSAPGVAAERAADDKEQKHQAAVGEAGHIFFPLAAEAFGHMDVRIDAAFRTLSRELPTHIARSFVGRMFYILACGIQCGNAGIMQTARRRLRRGLLA